MLVNHANPRVDGIGGGVNGDFLTPHQDFPFIRLVQPVKDVHQGGFARPVFPQQCQDFTLIQFKVDVIICQYAGETFCDVG